MKLPKRLWRQDSEALWAKLVATERRLSAVESELAQLQREQSLQTPGSPEPGADEFVTGYNTAVRDLWDQGHPQG